MKKILFLTLVFAAVMSFNSNAQAVSDQSNVLRQMKDQQKPGLVSKAGLTEEQADKIIEINYNFRMQAGKELQGLNETDRAKKLAELKEIKEKKYSEVLSADQIKAVKAYYEDMAKNAPKKPN